MTRAGFVVFTLAMAAVASPALAETHYMSCFGGGRAGLYLSAVYPVPETSKSAEAAKAFSAFVNGKYGHAILAQCHRDGTQAAAAAQKKSIVDADQKSKFPSRLVETGWAGN